MKKVWPLMLAIFLFMLGNGLGTSLLGVRSTLEGFSALAVGVMMAAYYLGYLAGSRLIPQMVGMVGHIRVFVGLASAASIVVLLHPLLIEVAVWSGMRLLTGFALAGLYVVSESWLNGLASNSNRGQILSVYMVMVLGGLGAGQIFLGIGSPDGMGLFILVSALFSLSLIPLSLTPSETPTCEQLEKKPNFLEVFRLTPLAMSGGVVVGLTNSTLLGMGPVYGAQRGFSGVVIGQFIALAMAGAVLFQWPIGRLSDRIPRRHVILVVNVASVALAWVGIWFSDSTLAIAAVMFAYGGLSFPLYGLAMSHMNDWISPRKLVSAAGALVFAVGVGAVAGPLVAGGWMALAGPVGLWWFLASVHGLYVCYILYRLTERPSIPVALQKVFAPLPARGSAMVTTLTPWRRTRSRRNGSQQESETLARI